MNTVSIQRISATSRPGFLRLRLNRPERHNAIDSSMLHGLAKALAADRREAIPLVIEGDPEFFSVGADITEMSACDEGAASTYSRLGHQVIEAVESWPGVTIAHLRGYTLGVGLELALGCDLLVGGPNVSLGLPGLAWALVPCMGGLRRLACRVSESFSSELFLNGEVLDAGRAMAHGLINRIEPDEQALDRFVAQMAEWSPSAVAAVRSLRLDHQGVIDSCVGSRMFSQPFASGECQRRLKALLAN
jgi:enoyl-CoA hydratase